MVWIQGIVEVVVVVAAVLAVAERRERGATVDHHPRVAFERMATCDCEQLMCRDNGDPLRIAYEKRCGKGG